MLDSPRRGSDREVGLVPSVGDRWYVEGQRKHRADAVAASCTADGAVFRPPAANTLLTYDIEFNHECSQCTLEVMYHSLY